MHHLIQNHDMVGSLENLDVLIVATGHNRRTGIEPQQTPLGEPAILGTIARNPSHPEQHGPFRRGGIGVIAALTDHPRSRLWQAPIWGVDDERGPHIVHDAGSSVEPIVIVATDIAAHR